jgi:hypothetical protein
MMKARQISAAHPHAHGGQQILLDPQAGWTWPLVISAVGQALAGHPEITEDFGSNLIVEIDLREHVVRLHRGPQ